MSNENLKKNVIVQGSILAAASIIVRIIGLIYRIPMTRILGDTAMGYYSYAYEIYNLALILSSYSLPLAVSKLVAARISKNEFGNAKKVFKVAIAFGAIVGMIATLLLVFLADAYGKLISCPNVAIPLKVLAPTIFVFSVMGVIRGWFQGFNNMVPTAISQVVEQIVNAAVSIGASYYFLKIFSSRSNVLAYGAAGGTLGTLSGAVAALVTLLIIFAIYKPLSGISKNQANKSTESNSFILKVLIATALPVILSQTIYQISGSLDSVMYNVVMSSKGLSEDVRSALWGIYSNKYRLLSNVPIAVASAMGTAVVPSLISEYTLGHMDKMKERIATVVKFNMIIAFPCAVGLSVLSSPILQLLFGDSSSTSANMMTIGGVCVIFFALSTVTNGVLQGINRMSLPVWHSAISLLIHIPVLYILLRFTPLNSYALVICNVLFPLVVCILNWRSIGKLIDYKQEVVKTFIIPLVSALLMGAAAFGIYHGTAFLGNTIATCISIVVAVMVYFVFLIKLKGVTKEELLNMPKGSLLVRIFTRIKLL
jgi:stage V sporulation protein B